MYILARLNYQCQGISVSNEFKSTGAKADAAPLKEAFAKKKAAGKEVKCAMTFPGGTHDMWIRYWLAAGGIDPDKDVSTIVVPPTTRIHADLAVARVLAIFIALCWNFSLNRRLTFSESRHGTSIVWQFLTYGLSNCLSILVSLGLSLGLPSRVPFFRSHKLLAAVVGIVVGTAISFSMARWVVFRKRSPMAAVVPSALDPTDDPDHNLAAARN